MCGITVLLNQTSQSISDALHAMSELIRHRGPDDEGYMQLDQYGDVHTSYGDDTPATVRSSPLPATPKQHIGEADIIAKFGMAHRRLAIVDPSPHGHQPMSRSEGRYWICYNGEIYNHIELRNELETLGHTFRSQSDTEVILAAYAAWGASCVHRFNGMWAFALVDRKAGTVFIARDRFGIKPLYYRVTPQGCLAFASEIKQFSALPDWQARTNPQAVHDFLVWNIIDHSDETLFDRVFQLPAGHAVTLKLDAPLENVRQDGRLTTTKWYSLAVTDFTGSYAEAAEEFRTLLADSVHLRLRADVPVGSCLSGGLDSSSIVCLMGKQLEKTGASLPSVFSAISDAAHIDERQWIDMVVAQTKAESKKILPEPDSLFEQLPKIIWHQDEPFCSTSIFAQWSVYQMVGDHPVNVILNGQGADEMLAGYHGFLAPRLVGLLRKGQLLELRKEISAMQHELGYSSFHALQRIADMLLPEFLRLPLRSWAGQPSSQRNAWLNDHYISSADLDTSAGIIPQSRSIQEHSRSLLLRRHLPMLLHNEDRNSMAHSVESRMPFLDYRLVELSLSLPDEFKLYRGLTKRVMRSAIQGIIPEPIRQRRDKIGFATPEAIWMQETAAPQFRKALECAVEQSAGILTPQAVQHFDEIRAGKQKFSFLPWRMIALGTWMERFQVEDS